jgi:hypothetical protein
MTIKRVQVNHNFLVRGILLVRDAVASVAAADDSCCTAAKARRRARNRVLKSAGKMGKITRLRNYNKTFTAEVAENTEGKN